MRPNNRQRSRGGRSGGGGGGHQHHKQHHGGPHNPNRPPNRNQIFDSSGPDVRVRGNAHQVFDKYQALAREAAASGDRIMAEAYWQYADHYYRVIQSMGGFAHRNNQGWGDGAEGDGQQGGQQGQPAGQQQPGGPNGYAQGEPHLQGDQPQDEAQQGDHQMREHQPPREHQPREPREHQPRDQQSREHQPRQHHRQRREQQQDHGESEPGLGGVAFLQSGRSAPANPDPAADEQPEIPEFAPAGAGRRG